MNEYIIKLAREKSFSDLHPEERVRVLAEMPEETYAVLRETLHRSALLDADALPPVALRQTLMAQYRRHRRHRPPPVWARPVPVWQAAAALLLLAGAILFWKTETVVERMVYQNVVITDTIRIEQPVWRDRLVIRERIVYREKQPDHSSRAAVEPAVLDTTRANAADIGASLGDLPDLFRFFSQAEE